MESSGHTSRSRNKSSEMDTLQMIFKLCLLGVLVGFGHSANPNYSYQVNIADPAQANFQQKGESRLGDAAQGFYSVVEPDGRLRTVTYVSDDQGFRPTVTYSYPHGQVNQVATKAVQPLVAGAPISNSLEAFSNAGIPLQYAASYGTPVYTVKDTRHFYKTDPPAAVIPQSGIVKAVAPVQNFLVAQPPIQKLVLTSAPAPVQKFVVAPPPVQKLIVAPAPVQNFVVAHPPVQKLIVAPAPVQKFVLASAPVQVIKAQPPATTEVPVGGYAYPVPEIKLEYPPPSPPPTSTPTTTTTESTPATTTEVLKETTVATSGGYEYPVPDKKLEYPLPKVETTTTTTTPVPETYLPPVSTEHVIQAVPPTEQTIVTPPPTQVVIAVSTVSPPQTTKYFQFGPKIKKIRKVQPVYHVAPVVAPQKVLLQHHTEIQPVIHKQPIIYQQPVIHKQPIIYQQPVIHKQPIVYQEPVIHKQPIIYQKPAVQYTHNPAQVFHHQLHYAQQQQLEPAPITHHVQATHVQPPVLQQVVAAQPPVQQVVYEQPPVQQVVYEQPPAQQVVYEQPPAQQVVFAQQPVQKVIAAQPPVQQVVYEQPPPQQFVFAQQPVQKVVAAQPPVQQVVFAQPTAQPVVVARPPVQQHTYEQIVEHLPQMRYATAPVTSYLPATQKVQEPAVIQAVAPAQLQVAPAQPVQGVVTKGRLNPLTFNYGYDNGISRVSHSYFGSGW